MELFFDSRWIGGHGIGRFAKEVRSRLPFAQDLPGRRKPSSALDALELSWRLAALPKSALFYSPGYNSPLASRVPFVFTIHDLNHIDFAPHRTRAKALYYERVMKPACRRAQAVITVSEYSRRRILEWSGLEAAAVINVGNGVDPVFTAQGLRYAHPRPYLFCVGNRKAHKNEARTLQAFAAVASQIPHDLLLAGHPSAELESELMALQLKDRVGFLGYLSDAGLASVYRGADAVLFASLYEGFGLPVIEAMASGTPVITSRAASLPEVAGNAALLVDPKSHDEISDAILRVLNDRALRRSLIDLGIINIQRFSWDATAATVRDVLRRVAPASTRSLDH